MIARAALAMALLFAHGTIMAEGVAKVDPGTLRNYQDIKTWHERYLSAEQGRQGRTEALRTIVRSGSLGERGLQRIFGDFKGRMAIDPRIPGVEKTARLLASSNRSQVKGHTRELLYAANLHTDGRNTLVQMSRKLDRAWGKTDADIVLQNRTTGLYGRIEVKDYSLRSQISNQDKLKVQMSKMGREWQRTGQLQFWMNRHGITPELQRHARRAGIVTLSSVATGRRLPPGTKSFEQALARIDNQFARTARVRALSGSAMVGFGAAMLWEALPGTVSAIREVAAEDASTAGWMRLGSSSSYTFGGAGLMSSGTAMLLAPRLSEAAQGKIYGLAPRLGLLSVASVGVGVGFDWLRYRRGAISSDQFWKSAVRSSAVSATAVAGAWIGGIAGYYASANPAGAAWGAALGGTAGAAAAEVAGAKVLMEIERRKRKEFDQVFGDTVSRSYGFAGVGAE